MSEIMADIFLMESYVSEEMTNRSPDSMTLIKIQFYKKILSQHKVDSVSYYTTFNYLQAHPKEFIEVLKLVDSTLNKINPGDSALIKPVITVPKNIEKLPNFSEQEKVMQEEYLKKHKQGGVSNEQKANKDKNK